MVETELVTTFLVNTSRASHSEDRTFLVFKAYFKIGMGIIILSIKLNSCSVDMKAFAMTYCLFSRLLHSITGSPGIGLARERIRWVIMSPLNRVLVGILVQSFYRLNGFRFSEWFLTQSV